MIKFFWFCGCLASLMLSCEELVSPPPNPPSPNNPSDNTPTPPPPPLCGNGQLDIYETCDDGNLDAGDGCSDICVTEYGYTCTDPGQPCKMNICDNCYTEPPQTHVFTRTNQVDNCHCPTEQPLFCIDGISDDACGPSCTDCTVFGAVCEMGACVCPEHTYELSFDAYQNTTTDLMLKSYAYDGQTNLETGSETEAVNALPYHLFQVDIEDAASIEIEYQGTTITGERIALYAWHPETRKWLIQQTAMQQDETGITLQLVLNADTYAENGKISLLAAPELNANGADTFAFTGDTQNYTSSSFFINGHSNGIYNHVTTWVKDQYQAGKIAYMHHAGDVVNCSTGEQWFEQEFDIADEAHRILEDAGVPYGITPGNHDILIKASSSEYHIRPMFDQTFSPERFKDFSWFVAGPEGYHTHYVLVTIAERDFIFVNVGYDVYPYEWINEVLAKYPHRIAVFSTHVYLSAGVKTHQAIRYHRNNIVPNKNVELVLAGHISQRIHATETLADGRNIHEIVVDHSNYHPHPDGAGAEGYIRLIRFADGKMYNTTYSPYRDEWLTDDEEQFTLDFPLRDSIRTLSTHHFVARPHCAVVH